MLKVFQGFRLNFINQNAKTLGGGVDKHHVVEWFKVYFWRAKHICWEVTQLSPKEIKPKVD